MAKTLVRDKDVAPKSAGYDGIQSDKITDAGQDNQFLTAAQKTALTGGGSADTMHWHSGFGALAVQMGRNGIVTAGQFLWANGIPSNVVGILLAVKGEVLSVAIAVAAPVGTPVVFRVLANTLTIDITIPAGQKTGIASGLTTKTFEAGEQLSCRVVSGTADKPSVLVELRWRQ